MMKTNSDIIYIYVIFILVIFILVIFAIIGRVQGVSMLTYDEINKINSVLTLACEQNEGLNKIGFAPSTRFQIDVECNNGASFSGIRYK